jgi:hypothetical protein
MPPPSDGAKDLSWLAHLELPDLPVRWDERVVRYLEFFRDDPRGHSTLVTLYRRSGRWREMMRRALRRKALPEDLVWVSMMESGFDAAARSPAGAAGLWQFMPETAKIYGLTIDRWLDQRLKALRKLGARARRVQHGLHGALVCRAPVQHERFLVARTDRGHLAVGDHRLRTEDPRSGGGSAQSGGVRSG